MPFGITRNETFAFIGKMSGKVAENKTVKRLVGGLAEQVWIPISSAAVTAVKDRFNNPKIPPQDPALVNLYCNMETIEQIPPLNADVTARYMLDEALKANDPGLFRKILQQAAIIQKLDPQTVGVTLVCCTASFAKKSAPYLKDICMGLITSI